jgi:arylsulfatase A-like enzyme
MFARIGTVLVGIGVLSGCGATGPAPPRPNVVLISLDTTRADHLGVYGYSRPTSPNLDRLARDSIVYTRAYATASWTLSSHASLFTGKFPTSHGAIHDADGPLKLTDAISGPPQWNARAVRPLAGDETTLAQILGEEGYRTGAVVAGPWMKKVFGLDRGFDVYDDAGITSIAGRRGDEVTAAALGFIEAESSQPFFLFLNYFDPHTPYLPPEDFARRFAASLGERPKSDDRWRKTRLYDAEIRYMDAQIGVFLDRLRELGVYAESLVIVTADHGELLGEHGEWGHVHHLLQEVLMIPLLVKPPSAAGWTPGTSDAPAQLVDVLPIVLHQLEIPLPEGIQGSLPALAAHPIVAEVYPHRNERWTGDWRALIEGTSKFLWSSRGDHQLFDLASDPSESNDRIEADPQRGEAMRARLLEYLASLPRPGPVSSPGTVDEPTREALKNLGYLE